MESIKKFENYPVGTIILSNLVSIAVYLLGFLVILRLGIAFSLLYLVFILILEFRLIKNHCTNCYYWGKTCGFGKGRISSLLFKKGNMAEFCKNALTWEALIPDMLVSLIPLVTGIILLILNFDFILLTALIFIVLLSTAGNSFIRGTLTCKHCKQLELGCPAFELLKKSNN